MSAPTTVDLGQLQQEAQLDGLEQVAVVALALVVHGDPGVALLEGVDVGERLLERLLGAEHRGVVVHRLLQRAADVGDALVAVLGEDVADPADHHAGGIGRHVDEVVAQRVVGRGDARAPAEYVDVQQRVGAQAVGAVHRDARTLTCGVQAGQGSGVVAQHLAADRRRNAAHDVVARRVDRHQLGDGVDTQVGAGELGDVGQLRLEHVRAEVAHVDVDVVLVGARAAALEHLEHHRPRHDVARRQVDDGRRVALHEALAVAVEQPAALAAHRLGDEDAQTGQARRVELVKLHVLQRKSLAEHDAQAVAGEGVGVGGGLVHPARPTGGEHDRLGAEDVDVTGGQLVGDDAGGDGPGLRLGDRDVQCVELVEELDVVLDAVLVQRLQDHVAGAVRGVARPAHGGLAVVAGVSAEPALVDASLGGAVERHAHLLEVQHRVDGFLAHDLDGVLVGEVVAALDGVEGVPLPVVIFDVGQRRAHSALRRAGVAAGRVQLRQHCGACPRTGLDRGPHARASCADDHDVVAMFDNHLSAPVTRCSRRR